MNVEKGLPANVDAERFVLGSVLLNGDLFIEVVGALEAEDFSQERHRRIFKRMNDLQDRGEVIDRITVANELSKYSELEGDGLGYLIELDDGLPQIPNIDSYVNIVKGKSILRRTIFACQHVMNRCLVAEDGAEDIISQAEAVLQKLSDATAQKRRWMNPGEIMLAYPGGINGFLSPSKNSGGIPTPWVKLNDMTCGLHRGDLVVVAGRPSMGKTVAAMNLAHHVAKQPGGWGVGVISLEMSKEDLLQRMACAASRVDSQRFRAGYLNQDERAKLNHAVHELNSLPLWFDDTGARTIPAMNAQIRRLAAQHPLSVIIVDHLQLIRSIGRSENRHQEVSEFTHGLKHAAKDHNVVMVLLSQLNRRCEEENRRPELSDLKESGTIEEDADVVVFVHRWERYQKYRQDDSKKGLAEFLLAKQRSGPTGLINTVFLERQQKFENRAEDLGELPDDYE